MLREEIRGDIEGFQYITDRDFFISDMLESQAKRLELVGVNEDIRGLEKALNEKKAVKRLLEIDLQSAIAAEISRENNLTLVEVYKLGPRMPHHGTLERKVLLKDLKEELQKEILEKGEVSFSGGSNPASWSGTRYAVIA